MIATASDRTPPSNIDAENGTIGSMLLDHRTIDDVALIVRAEDFHLPENGKLFAHVVAIHSTGKAIDLTLLVERLKTSGDLEAVGGMARLIEIVESVPTAANAVWYAKIVSDKAKLRNFIAATESTLREAYRADDVEGVIAAAEQRLRSVVDGNRSETVVKIGPALSDRMAELDRRLAGEKPAGINCGLVDVHRLTGLFSPGEMIVVGARPSQGKTAAGVCFANAAADKGEAVLLFSMEMGRGEICDRFLSARSGVNGQRIRDARLSADDRRALIDAQCELDGLNILIDDATRRTATDIAAQTRRVQRHTKLGLVVVDYIGLIQPENKRDPRHEQVAAIARRLKLMAKELAVPVVVLAQLNREVEKGTEHRPKLAHLRESGAIEQDADVVLLLHREGAYRPHDEDLRGKAEIIVAKNRRGPTGIANVTWHAETAQFKNAAKGEEWDYA